ncbi:condensation domain-containing protein [Edaphovirga cremea]|uniref:condensation domain-containing protein n=1 Tax=Edaphovirga cremea TaxID=2267246 RepID=UPI000DEF6F3E|nr:condensation domain-containing protein [Edaphovirga cremea]
MSIQPSEYIEHENTPYTFTHANKGRAGKVHLQWQLPELEGNKRSSAPYAPPRTQTEILLAGIWAEVLGSRQPIGRNDDFFILGGHPLRVTQVQKIFHARSGNRRPLHEFFSFPRLRDLAKIIDSSKNHVPVTSFFSIRHRAQYGEWIPLTSEQKQKWLDDQHRQTPLHVIPATFHIEGELDIPRLEHALHQLILRHDSLRTSIIEQEGEVYQYVHDVAFSLPLITLRSGYELQQRLKREVEQTFDFSRGPLWRIALFKVMKSSWYLSITFHSIIADGGSIENFYRELEILYRDSPTVKTSLLPTLPLQYADYCLWQHRHDFSADLVFWQRRLAGVTPLNLPIKDRLPVNLNVTKSAGTERRTLNLTPDLYSQLERFAAQHHTGLFTLFYSGFALLLSHYCSQKDIALSTLWPNRPFSGLSGLIGHFANRLILRTSVDMTQSVSAFLQQNHQHLTATFEHGFVPVQRVLAQTDLPYCDNGQHPLCSVALVMQQSDITQLNLAGAKVTFCPLPEIPATFDLLLNITLQQGRCMKIEACYRQDLWSCDIMNALLGDYGRILAALNSAALLADVPLANSPARKFVP